MVDLKNISQNHLWYVIGYITADGSLSKDKRHINITSKDGDHLEKIKTKLGLKIKVGQKARGREKIKKYYQLQIGDVNFYNFLKNIGLIPNKSTQLKILKIKTEYFPDFLRGVIDGDGCISTWIHKNNSLPQWSLRITSAAPIFIEWLKNEIENKFEIKGKLYKYHYQNKPNPIFILKFGKLPAKIIINKCYYNKALALDRKYQSARVCLQDKNKMINYGGIVTNSPGAVIGSQVRLKI